MGWGEFAAALVVFMVFHAVPVRPPVRPWLVGRLGERGFTYVYSTLSLALLAWLIVAAGRAPMVPLWPSAAWQNMVALAAMLPACVLVALAVGRPNPFSFGGAPGARFDPARPGVVAMTRHPLPLALAIWAGAHTLVNGDLAHVILFGSFAGFALAGPRLIDRRKRRQMGTDWDALHRRLATLRPAERLRAAADSRVRLVAGVALYAALIALHPLVIGVSPLP